MTPRRKESPLLETAMYQAIDDAVLIGFVVFATVMAWWLLFDADGTVGGTEID